MNLLFIPCVKVTRQPLIKSMRVVKKETLKLISNWVERSTDPQMVLENFIPPMLEAVLADYQRCAVPSARYEYQTTGIGYTLRRKSGYRERTVRSISVETVSLDLRGH